MTISELGRRGMDVTNDSHISAASTRLLELVALSQ
jgi:hypothetical protein